MLPTFRLAWRNLGRNRRRTAITSVALALGVSLSVASFGLMDGMVAELLRALTRYELGHVQVHHPDYPRSRALEDTIEGPDALLSAARGVEGVRGAAPRVYAFALLSHGGTSSGAQIVGVDPDAEPRITTLDQELVAGSYLEGAPTPWPRGRELTPEEQALDEELTREAEEEVLAEIEALDEEAEGDRDRVQDQAREEKSERELSLELARTLSPPPERPPRVFVGEALARVLDAGLGDRIHATGRTVDGGAEEVFLEIAGIYRTGNVAFDRNRLYMHIEDVQRFTHLYDRVHEIAVVTDAPEQAGAIAARLDAALDGRRDLLVRPWDEIRPDIRQMIDLSNVSTGVMVFIIFVVATLGVVNTMLMAVFERTRELGMLKAIGMSGGRIVRLIVTETLLLVLLASGIGTALGLGLDLYMVHHGVDLSGITGGFTVGGVGIRPVFHGKITAHGIILPTAILSATCLLASLYPALRAARLRPAVGMRET